MSKKKSAAFLKGNRRDLSQRKQLAPANVNDSG
jgi:hypothetical protein